MRGLERAEPAKKHRCSFRLAGPGLWLSGQSHGGCPCVGPKTSCIPCLVFPPSWAQGALLLGPPFWFRPPRKSSWQGVHRVWHRRLTTSHSPTCRTGGKAGPRTGLGWPLPTPLGPDRVFPLGLLQGEPQRPSQLWFLRALPQLPSAHAQPRPLLWPSPGGRVPQSFQKQPGQPRRHSGQY